MKRSTFFSVLTVTFLLFTNLIPVSPVRADSTSLKSQQTLPNPAVKQPVAQAASILPQASKLALSNGLTAPPPPAPAAEEDALGLVVHLQTPPYQAMTRSDGYDEIKIAGYDQVGAPGDPALPGKIFHIALPPDVLADSVHVQVLRSTSVVLPGTYKFAPVPPPVTYQDGQTILSYGEHAATMVDGKNVAVYRLDAWFPAAVTGSLGQSQMRKWRFANLPFTPVQYNPLTGQAQVTTALDVRVAYQRAAVPLAPAQVELNDTVMDGEAAQLLYNYTQASSWYTPALSPAGADTSLPGYVIITTNAIAAASAKLTAFVSNLQTRGFAVQIVTETQYAGLTGQAPNGTAEKIRQWLKNNYLSQKINYALLIGNPNPTSGDVPMKMMWPRIAQNDGYRESPTDYFYADLTGNWNKDGDQYFGEAGSDGGSGGVDFAPEVYVGRIPVYTNVTGWGTTLNSILQKIMDYANSYDTSWRKAALLPMSFSDYYTDGAAMGEQMKNDYLNGLGFATTTLYQHKTANCNTPSVSSANLVDGKVKSLWSANPYGLVTWWGHGNDTGAYVGYGGDCSDGTIFTSYDTYLLDNTHPAVVFQNSCSNGAPENNINLGYALLIKGAAATVSASRVSWYSVGTWEPEIYLGDNASLGYYFSQQVANGATLGKALYDTKDAIGPGWSWGGETWMNLMDFNLYGDPASSLYSCKDTHEPNNDPDLATPLSYGQTLTADICARGDSDYYTFSGNSGGKLAIDVDAEVNGSKLDSYVALFSANGSTLIADNDDDGLTKDSMLEFTLKTSGTYTIKVSAWNDPTVGGPEDFYSIRLINLPSVTITSPVASSWINPTQTAVTVNASDAESSVQRIDFYWHNENVQSPPMDYLGSDTNGTDGWSFNFNTNVEPEQMSGSLYAYAHDNVGAVFSTSVYGLGIDRQPPGGSVTVSSPGDGGSLIMLQLVATDSLSGIGDMRISNAPGFLSGAWQPFSTPVYWPVPPKGGVFIQFRDNAGNVSRILCSDEACSTIYLPE